MRGELIALEAIGDWDLLIGNYPQKTVYHESIWLRFLEADQRGRATVLRIADSTGQVRAWWPGLVVRKGPIRIFGSPLRGWGTVAMGPLYHEVETPDLLSGAERALRGAGIHHWEFVSETLSTGPAPALGYRLETSDTHRIPLDPDEEKMWARLTVRCRTSTRKAVKSGLTVRVAEDDRFLEPFYRILLDVFARRGTTPSYDLPRLKRLWTALHPAGRTFGVEVLAAGELAAAGLFVCDERQAYTWAEGSDARFNALGPNNLCYWEAMRLFSRRGGSYLHSPGAAVGGIGKFKASFNPEILQYPYWIRDRSRLFRWSRGLYERLARQQARWRRHFARRPDRQGAGEGRED